MSAGRDGRARVHRSARVRVRVVRERHLDRHDRRRLGALLADAFGDEQVREPAHYGDPPDWRVIARAGPTPVAQAAVWRMRAFPRGLCVYGIGDVAVRPSERGRGLAATVVGDAVGLALASAPDLVVTRTVLLRSVFTRLGFRALAAGNRRALAPSEDWMGWWRGVSPPAVTRLEPDDV